MDLLDKFPEYVKTLVKHYVLGIPFIERHKNGGYTKGFLNSNNGRTGACLCFAKCKRLVWIANFKDDKLHGELKRWYPNGVLELDRIYHNGKQEGEQRVYADDGTLIFQGYYIKSESEY